MSRKHWDKEWQNRARELPRTYCMETLVRGNYSDLTASMMCISIRRIKDMKECTSVKIFSDETIRNAALARIKMKKSEVNIFGTRRCGSYVFEDGIERLMESFTA